MEKGSQDIFTLATRALSPLDRVRRAILKSLGRPGVVVLRRRELRVGLGGLAIIFFAMAGTLLAPFWLLTLGPIVLGTAHLVADFRYMVIRPGLHLRKSLCLAAGIPLALAGMGFFSVTSGLISCAAAAVMSQGSQGRKVAAIALIAPLVVASAMVGPVSGLIVAHLHNFIALIVWWKWRPRTDWLSSALFPVFVLCVACFVVGAPESWALGMTAQPAGMGAAFHLDFLAPGVPEPWGIRLVLLFAFAQSVHYGVWLRLIPDDDRVQPTPRTFRASARALRADFGTPLLFGACVLALGIALWAAADLAAARDGYFRMALFHGYLELTAITCLWVEAGSGHFHLGSRPLPSNVSPAPQTS